MCRKTAFMCSAIQHIPHISISDLMWSFLGHLSTAGLKNARHLKAPGDKKSQKRTSFQYMEGLTEKHLPQTQSKQHSGRQVSGHGILMS